MLRSKTIFVYFVIVLCIWFVGAGVAFSQSIPFALVDGTVVETSTGNTIALKLISLQGAETAPGPHQDDHTGGVGLINAYLKGQSGIPVSACSVHGPVAPDDYDVYNMNSGFFPMQSVECGLAFGETVSIDECTMKASFHGYAHTDNPRINFLGITTIDISVRKTKTKVFSDITIYTPKGRVDISGELQGTVQLSTCN